MVNDYMTGISADYNFPSSTTSTGNYDYSPYSWEIMQRQIQAGMEAQQYAISQAPELETKEPINKNKTNKMEVELCLCSKALWN